MHLAGSTSDDPSCSKSESPPHSPTIDLAKDFNLGSNDSPSLPPLPHSIESTDESSTDEAVFSDEDEEEKTPPPPPPPPPEAPPAEVKEKVRDCLQSIAVIGSG